MLPPLLCSKHDTPGGEAVTVFRDPLASTIPEPAHSLGEERYLTVGLSIRGRLPVVSYTERQDQLRLISCRALSPAGAGL
jgi:uncharacterized DUF497 family protein